MKLFEKIAERLDLVKGFEEKVFKDYGITLNLSEEEKAKLKSLDTHNIARLPSILKVWSKAESSLVNATGNGTFNIKWLINQADNDSTVSLREVFLLLQERCKLNPVNFTAFGRRMNELHASDRRAF